MLSYGTSLFIFVKNYFNDQSNRLVEYLQILFQNIFE